MDHLQIARKKVVKYIKTGKITQDQGQVALEHVKKFAMQGKMADVDVILEKMGAKKNTPKKKMLEVDEASNPYLQKRKERSKTPLFICLGCLLVASVTFFVIYSSKKQQAADHDEALRQQRQQRSQANSEASDYNSEIGDIEIDPEVK